MIGAIVGDIVGSRFELNNIKSKEFELFTQFNRVTDDSILTLAVSKAIMESKDNLVDLEKTTINYLKTFAKKYPNAGYGSRFIDWVNSVNFLPYNSYGNGSAMRISPIADVAKSKEEVILLSDIISSVTHNHPEGIKGARATAISIYLAKIGKPKDEIKSEIENEYYNLHFCIDEIREDYKFSSKCQDSVPQAIVAFLESKDFEDAIRIAISLGGDSDTIAAITGSIAEQYYNVPKWIKNKALKYLDKEQLDIYYKWEEFIKTN